MQTEVAVVALARELVDFYMGGRAIPRSDCMNQQYDRIATGKDPRARMESPCLPFSVAITANPSMKIVAAPTKSNIEHCGL